LGKDPFFGWTPKQEQLMNVGRGVGRCVTFLMMRKGACSSLFSQFRMCAINGLLNLKDGTLQL